MHRRTFKSYGILWYYAIKVCNKKENRGNWKKIYEINALKDEKFGINEIHAYRIISTMIPLFHSLNSSVEITFPQNENVIFE